MPSHSAQPPFAHLPDILHSEDYGPGNTIALQPNGTVIFDHDPKQPGIIYTIANHPDGYLCLQVSQGRVTAGSIIDPILQLHELNTYLDFNIPAANLQTTRTQVSTLLRYTPNCHYLFQVESIDSKTTRITRVA